MTYSTDIIIIGGGPAGLSAAIYALRAGKKVMVFDKLMFGGQTINTPEIENYPAINSINGVDFAMQLTSHATELGAETIYSGITSVDFSEDVKKVFCGETLYTAKSIIIANGAERRKLECDGEERLNGRGISYCATCDGSFYKDKDVVIAGSGNTAAEDSVYLSNICKSVTMLIRGDVFKASAVLKKSVEQRENIKIVYNESIIKVDGENFVSSVTTLNKETREEKTYETSGVFVAVGLNPDNSMFKDFINIDKSGYIIADETCTTNVQGVFVAGDTRTKKLRQVVTAAADGAIAGNNASEYIDTHLN